MSAPAPVANESKDWSRQPVGITFWWVLPIVTAISTNFLTLSLAAAALVWAVAFAWMGTGCLLNARRCSRLHCLVAGPVFWLGAIAAGLVAPGLLPGTHALNSVIWGTVVLAILSNVPEKILGREYARHG